MEDVEGDWDLMLEKLYTAEDRIEAEKKMWSGSTGTSKWTEGTKYCANHQDSKSHTTEECTAGKSKGKGKGGGSKGKGGGKGKKGAGKDKSQVQCHNCWEWGHYTGECTNAYKPEPSSQHENDKPNSWSRSLTPQERVALATYSKHRNRQMKDVKIEEVKADGGLDKWGPEKEKKFEPPGPKKLFPIQRERGIN